MTEVEKRSVLSFFTTTTNCSLILIVAVVAFMYYVHTEIDRLDNKMDYAMKQTNDADIVKMLSGISNKVTTPSSSLDPAAPPSNHQASPEASPPLPEASNSPLTTGNKTN